jgi:hypothetical protein
LKEIIDFLITIFGTNKTNKTNKTKQNKQNKQNKTKQNKTKMTVMSKYMAHPFFLEVGPNKLGVTVPLHVTVCRFDDGVSCYASDKNTKGGLTVLSGEHVGALAEFLASLATGTKVMVTAGDTLEKRQAVATVAKMVRDDLIYEALSPEQESMLVILSVPHLIQPGIILVNSGKTTTNFVGVLADGRFITLEASTKDPEAMAHSMLSVIEAVGTVRNVILAGSMAFVPLWIGVPCHESWMTSMSLEDFMAAVLHQFQVHKDSAEKRPPCFPGAIQESIMCMLEAMSGKVEHVYIGARPSKAGVEPPIEELYEILEPDGVASTPTVMGTL